MTDIRPRCVTALVALVKAYVANNRLPVSEVPRLVKLVHDALLALSDGSTPSPGVPDVGRPNAEAIRRSVRHDGIVSFVNGRTYRSLKRHLTANGLGPKAYRERYGLPIDYPMVAAAYSESRSRIAKDIGLGVSIDRGGDVEDVGRTVAQRRGGSAKHFQQA